MASCLAWILDDIDMCQQRCPELCTSSSILGSSISPSRCRTFYMKGVAVIRQRHVNVEYCLNTKYLFILFMQRHLLLSYPKPSHSSCVIRDPQRRGVANDLIAHAIPWEGTMYTHYCYHCNFSLCRPLGVHQHPFLTSDILQVMLLATNSWYINLTP